MNAANAVAAGATRVGELEEFFNAVRHRVAPAAAPLNKKNTATRGWSSTSASSSSAAAGPSPSFQCWDSMLSNALNIFVVEAETEEEKLLVRPDMCTLVFLCLDHWCSCVVSVIICCASEGTRMCRIDQHAHQQRSEGRNGRQTACLCHHLRPATRHLVNFKSCGTTAWYRHTARQADKTREKRLLVRQLKATGPLLRLPQHSVLLDPLYHHALVALWQRTPHGPNTTAVPPSLLLLFATHSQLLLERHPPTRPSPKTRLRSRWSGPLGGHWCAYR